MESLQGIIGRVLKKRGLAGEAKASHITFVAERLIASKMPALTKDVSVKEFKDSILLLETKTSSAAQSVRDLLPYLKRQLQKDFGLELEIHIIRAK